MHVLLFHHLANTMGPRICTTLAPEEGNTLSPDPPGTAVYAATKGCFSFLSMYSNTCPLHLPPLRDKILVLQVSWSRYSQQTRLGLGFGLGVGLGLVLKFGSELRLG